MSDNQSKDVGDCMAKTVTNCRARRMGGSNLVECKTEVASCHWHIPFGVGRLCGHVSNQMIAMGVIPAGWSPNSANTS